MSKYAGKSDYNLWNIWLRQTAVRRNDNIKKQKKKNIFEIVSIDKRSPGFLYNIMALTNIARFAIKIQFSLLPVYGAR